MYAGVAGGVRAEIEARLHNERGQRGVPKFRKLVQSWLKSGGTLGTTPATKQRSSQAAESTLCLRRVELICTCTGAGPRMTVGLGPERETAFQPYMCIEYCNNRNDH